MRTRTEVKPSPYSDPNDKRLSTVIESASRAQQRAVNILGVPFDGAVLGRKGAAGGPSGVRDALSGFSNYSPELGLSLEEARIFDLGDIVFGGQDVEAAHSVIEEEAEECIRLGSLLAVLGGDNSISLPCIRAVAGKFRRIGLVVLDSHFDLRGRIGGKPTSGSSYGLAIETVQELDAKRVSEVGIHGFLNSRKYARMAEQEGVAVFTAAEVFERGMENVIGDAYRTARKGADAVYFSVDLDVVDAAYVSGVSAPSSGGIGAKDLFEAAFYMGSKTDVHCADIVELAPSLDASGKSQIVAATALVYLAAGFASRRD